MKEEKKVSLSGTDPRPPGLAMLKDLGLTKEEEEFLNGRYNGESLVTAARNIADVYVAKTVQNASSEVIESNKRLTRSNDRHARAMRWLTVALIAVGVAQVIVAVISNGSA